MFELTNGMEHQRNWQIEEGSSSKGKQKLKGSPLYVLDNGIWSVNRDEEIPARNEEITALPNECTGVRCWRNSTCVVVCSHKTIL
uniref:Uncharacterized protein n=1 Tax=Meloidogyne enterolobii TaxID=390850 RepID=A0A6V7VNF2_MELEN|nr:unnamed protein product [Meloidogyne enterolobii]